MLHLGERNVLTLSGGERARVMLARARAAAPRFLLADEPVVGLDPAHQLQVMALLRLRAEAGMGVIVTLHDLGLAGRFCDRIVMLAASGSDLLDEAARETIARWRFRPAVHGGQAVAGDTGMRIAVSLRICVDRRCAIVRS